jgi:hypothetical protein
MVHFGEHLFPVGQRSELLHDVVIVADVISVVVIRRFVDRRKPDDIDAELLQIVQLLNNSSQIADAVAVAIIEAARINLVDNAFLPPLLLHG